MAEPDKVAQALAGFELLLAAAASLVRRKSSQKTLLAAYDDASERLMEGLRRDGVPEEKLQSIHKALARLRLAFEETYP